MGESENSESDFIRVVTSLFKDDIEEAVKKVYKNRIRPTIKKTVSDSLKDLVDQMFGTTSTVSNIPAGSVAQNNQKVPYNKMFTGSSPATTSSTTTTSTTQALPSAGGTTTTTPTNTTYNALPHNVIVASYQDAQNIVDVMNDKLRAEGEVSVNDLFDFAGQASAIAGSSTATKYGWHNIDGHTITELPTGEFMLAMPHYDWL